MQGRNEYRANQISAGSKKSYSISIILIEFKTPHIVYFENKSPSINYVKALFLNLINGSFLKDCDKLLVFSKSWLRLFYIHIHTSKSDVDRAVFFKLFLYFLSAFFKKAF